MHSVKLGFCASTKVFEKELNAVKFLDWLKKFGPAKNILELVKGQGIGKGFAEIDCWYTVSDRNGFCLRISIIDGALINFTIEPIYCS